MTIPVLFDRSGVIAVIKPTGLASQAPPGIPSVESLMRERLFGDAFQADLAAGRRRHPGGFLGMPHRLDRAVSGVLLMATTPRAARQLSRQFEQRTIDKAYLAVVAAAVPPTTLADAFEWRDLIRKVPDEPRAEIVAGDITGAREAITEGHLLTAESDRLLLSLSPRTGRMHQLRLQAAARGMPIVGDTLYGGRPLPEAASLDERRRPIALHAWRITFQDPDSAERITLEAPLPEAFPWTAPVVRSVVSQPSSQSP